MPTALELTPAQLERFKENARQRLTKSNLSASMEAERNVVLKRVAEASHILKKRFGAQRVILFGSLSHQAWFSPDSDVDLAVEGLTGNYWEAWRQIEAILNDRKVDLIELESAPESLRRVIEKDGMAL